MSEQVGTYIGLSSQPLSSRDASMPPTEPACMQKRKRTARLFCHQHFLAYVCPEPVLANLSYVCCAEPVLARSGF